jgi:glycosyltransferase involved in cell wall biosynthesis
MKILQIVPSISLVYGGPSQMVLGLAKALAKQDVQVTIITTDSNGDTGQEPLSVPLKISVPQNGYEIIYFRCFPFRRYKFSLDLLQWLFNHASEYDLAHIHALFSPISTAAATIARNRNLPYILRPLGTLDPADLEKKKLLKTIYGNLWEKPNLAGAAGVHFTTQQECRVSARFGAKTKDLIVPLGVELPRNRPEKGSFRQELGINPELPVILFVSRLDRKKGLDILLPALENLLAEGLQFHFVLAGNNPQDLEYERSITIMIRNSSLNHCTTITGFVSGARKLALFQDADVFVLPSYYENFGIAVAEAMSCSLPVVISNGVHIGDEVEAVEAGWVSSCNLIDFTDKLRLALIDRDERQRRGINGQKYALEHYSWRSIVDQIIPIYQSFIKKD